MVTARRTAYNADDVSRDEDMPLVPLTSICMLIQKRVCPQKTNTFISIRLSLVNENEKKACIL